MRVSEWIVVVYFLYLVLAALARPVKMRARARVILWSLALMTVAALSSALPSDFWFLRDLLPLVHLLAGYWLPALLVADSDSRFERRLIESDAWLEQAFHIESTAARWPRVLLEALELSYFLSYVLVPLGLAAIWLGGRSDAADRYWSAALVAHLSAFGALAWLDARPPWSLEPSPLDARRILMRRLNLLVVNSGSNRRNTFPSGHAAGAVAIAAFMLVTVPPAGPAFVLLATGICVGAYIGRYHYAVDVIAGVVTGFLSWQLVRWLM